MSVTSPKSVDLADLADLAFADLYLCKEFGHCCYKSQAGASTAQPIDPALQQSLALVYEHLLTLPYQSGDHFSLQWPPILTMPIEASSGEQMQTPAHSIVTSIVRIMRLEMAGSQTMFFIRRYNHPPTGLSELGVSKRIADHLLNQNLRDRLIIICGAAGVGKTSLALTLVTERLKALGGVAVSVENPIEMPLSGRHGQGLFYQKEVAQDSQMAHVIVDFMRACPNMIFIGEIRDEAAAKAAVNAALAGSLVIATFHADSLIGAVERLARMSTQGNDSPLAVALAAVIHIDVKKHQLDTKSNLAFEQMQRSDTSRSISLLSLTGNTAKAIASQIRSGAFHQLQSEIERQQHCLINGASI